MTADNFRSALRKKPFLPFIIRTSSGESYAVSHPEVAWVSPAGSLVIVSVRGQQGEAVAMLDLPSISEITYAIGQPAEGPANDS